MRLPLPIRALAAATLSGIATAQTMAPPPGGMGLMAALTRADANHDGMVTRDEVVASSDALFDRLDTNHDGTVTPEEMAAARPMRGGRALPPPGDPVMPPPPAGSAAAPAPGRAVTPPPSGARAAPPMPPPPARSMTRQQWHDRALAQFDRVDANHDGRVDQTEMQAWREAMRQRRDARRAGDAPPPPGQ